MTSRIDVLSLANGLLPAVLEAGRIEMSYYDSQVAVERKADQSPVTEADREAEAILLAALSKLSPEIPTVAEEQAAAGHTPNVGDCFYLVDPLDGTREFIKKRGEFTINVGLIERGTPVFGLIYAPVIKRLFVTTGPHLALEFDIPPSSSARSLSSLPARKLAVRRPQHNALVAFASRSSGSERTDALLAKFNVSETRQVGSSLKFCLLANGEADIYPRLGPTNEWDTAAGHAILSVAGGHVTDLSGKPLRYGKTETNFLNPEFIAWGGLGPSGMPDATTFGAVDRQ